MHLFIYLRFLWFLSYSLIQTWLVWQSLSCDAPRDSVTSPDTPSQARRSTAAERRSGVRRSEFISKYLICTFISSRPSQIAHACWLLAPVGYHKFPHHYIYIHLYMYLYIIYPPTSTDIHIYYIYIERERKRDMHLIYIYIYVYMCV